MSWYASGVIYDYNIQVAIGANYVYEFGPALYVGWVSGVSACEHFCCEHIYNYAQKLPTTAIIPRIAYSSRESLE